jgi:hypothetical protein
MATEHYGQFGIAVRCSTIVATTRAVAQLANHLFDGHQTLVDFGGLFLFLLGPCCSISGTFIARQITKHQGATYSGLKDQSFEGLSLLRSLDGPLHVVYWLVYFGIGLSSGCHAFDRFAAISSGSHEHLERSASNVRPLALL